MSIQSTQLITLQEAIERIKEIVALIQAKNYREIESISCESDCDVEKFVEANSSIDISNIKNWTNRMLEEKMDEPYFRISMFNNYLIEVVYK